MVPKIGQLVLAKPWAYDHQGKFQLAKVLTVVLPVPGGVGGRFVGVQILSVEPKEWHRVNDWSLCNGDPWNCNLNLNELIPLPETITKDQLEAVKAILCSQ